MTAKHNEKEVLFPVGPKASYWSETTLGWQGGDFPDGPVVEPMLPMLRALV